MDRRDFLKAMGRGTLLVVGLGGWDAPAPRPLGRRIRMVQDGFLWVEAADFTEFGGWFLDTQFVHLMGSAYLLAKGAGTPVRDAFVEVDIPYPATYRLWVRAKNWQPEYSPGRFQVLINGTPAKPVFGTAPKDEWLWQSAGEFRLAQGRTRLALHDLTGYYGRCATLLLTTDLTYTPPLEVERLWQERARLAGISLEPEEGGEFEVIVVGAGAAGCCAALAAARMGARTALIQDRPVLGGNASDELGVSIAGASVSHPHARESGIIEEARLIANRYGHSRMSEPFRLLTQAQENLTVIPEQRVIGVRMADESTIASVRTLHTRTGERREYRGQMFIDCTGDGWVGYYAGAQYRIGREARDEFKEDLAPEKADSITMSGCLMSQGFISFRAAKANRSVPFTPPPWAAKLPPPEKFGRRIRRVTTGEWWIEHPGNIDDLWEMEKARDELIRIAFGYWDFIKNRWPEKEQAAYYRLDEVFVMLAKRETRRLLGDYILKQDDAQSGRLFPDRVAYGGWPLDVHHPQGIFSGPEGPYYCNPHVPIYTIPFRCLYSANIRNLLFAGRDISVTHIALGTVRVQATLSLLGQAVGTAAAMCLERDLTPRELGQRYCKELQQTLLKHDQYIPGLQNEDPLDLARQAKVSASSTATHQTFGPREVKEDLAHPLNMPRAVLFPAGQEKRIESIRLLLISENDAPTEVTLHLRGASLPENFSSREDLLTVQALVPPQREAWVEFSLHHEPQTPYLWVWLPKTEGLYWRLMKTAPLGSCRAWGGDGSWQVVKGQYYAFYTRPAIRLETDYRPENLLNGVTRFTEEGSNLWVSDPAQPLPQWVELAWDEPVEANAVYLTFDTDLNPRWPESPVVKECVRDYELSYHHGRGWVPLTSVRDNFQRRRVHRFEAVRMAKLRLTLQATNGAPSARVFEMRVYKE